MHNDIVTRLRNVTYGVESVVYHAIMDSIDEIERLRELLWKYENCEMVRESPCDIDWEGGECETCDKHRKAVRGE